MATEMMRTHVVLPRKLVQAIDARAGQRRRSEFIAAAVERQLKRQELLEALHAAAGSLADEDIPGWESSESAAAWVREQRCAWPDHWKGDAE